MKKDWRFVYQDNMYWASCEPCTKAVFSTMVRNATVNRSIHLRRAIREAVREGKPLDEFTRLDDFQRWCYYMQSRPRAGEKFAALTTAAKLLQWGDKLKNELPCFIFAVKEFGLVPRTDRDGNPVLDPEGNPFLYRRRKQSNIVHLSGLFMSDFDHLPFPPQELYELTRRPGYPWKTRLAHLTSSGEGLRLVSECIPEAGNIADQQYLQAKVLGMLEVKGTTGTYVTDNSCINADKLSFCPRLDDILFIDEDKLFKY